MDDDTDVHCATGAATPGAVRVEAEDRPLLEGEASEGDGLFAALMTARPQMLEASTVRLLSAG